MESNDQTLRGQVIAGGQRVTVEESADGAQALAAAVLERTVKDAQAGDAAAAWAAWAGVGLHLAMGLGLDAETWYARLRIAGIEKPEKEPPEPIEPREIEPRVLVGVFRVVEPGAILQMGELRRPGRKRSGSGALVELGLAVRVPADDYEGRDILRRVCQLLTMCQGDGRAAVAELVQDQDFVARVLRWADLAE